MPLHRYLLLTGLFFLWGCNGSQRGEKNANKDLSLPPEDNYIVLFDAGTRILSGNPEQVSKDIAAIKSIYGIFKAKLGAKDSTYYNINDKLKLLEAPNSYHASIDLSAEQPDKKASLADEMEKSFDTLLPAIYNAAIVNNTGSTAAPQGYLWKYFNQHLTGDLKNGVQNTLFIISDGYMDLENTEAGAAQKNRYTSCTQVINALKTYPDWETKFNEEDYGILPVRKKFNNLRVIVIGVNPKEGWNGEYSLLTKIWSKWLTEMNINDYDFIKNDNVDEVKESLGKLMGVNMDGTLSSGQVTKTSVGDTILTALPDTAKQKNSIAPLTSAVASAEKKPDTEKKAVIITNPPLLPVEPAPRLVNKKTGNPAVEKQAVKQLPVIVKEKPGIILLPPLPAGTERKTPDVAKKTVSVGTRTIPRYNSQVRKTAAREDDILKDGGAANGFNTGIKKESKKKNP